MKRFVEGEDRTQSTLFPERLDEYISEENPVRVIEAFIDELDLKVLGFEGIEPRTTGRPAYHPLVLLKLYIYGYLNRIQSSRRLERESQRNVEVMWLMRRLMPDHKTIAAFRKNNGRALRGVCREFVVLCRGLSLFTESVVAIDGSKFKAVNNRDRNFTGAKMKRRLQQIEESIDRYLSQLDTANRQESSEVAQAKVDRLQDKIATLVADRGYFDGEEIRACEEDGITTFVPKPLTSGSKAEGRFGKQDFVSIAHDDEYRCPAGQRLIKRFTTVEAGMTLDVYWSSACPHCPMKAQCTTGKERRVRRWEHEAVLDAMQARLDADPEKMRVRRQTAEHPFGTIKLWMGWTHFLTKTLGGVSTEMSLHVLAYNIKRVIKMLGPRALIQAIRALKTGSGLQSEAMAAA